MEVSCGSCPARFAVPDEKVRGKKVRINCKRCHSPIIVDGTKLAGTPAAAAPKPAAAAAKPAAAVPTAAKAPPASAAAAATPKPSAAAGPKPAAKAPAVPAAAAKPKPAPVVAPKPATSSAQPAPAAATTAAKLAAGAPKPERTAAEPAPASKPQKVAKPEPKLPEPSAPKPDWAALGSSGKTGAWREPASTRVPSTTPSGPGPASAPRPGAAPVSVPRPGAAPVSVPRPGAAPVSVARPGAGAAPAGTAQNKAAARRTMLGVAPPAVAPPPPPPPEPESGEGEPEWTVALTDDQHEEMRTPEVVELYVRGSIDHETFIWAEGMEDWKRPWEIPLIARALEARGLHEPSAEESDDTGFLPDDYEPAAEDATIVASVRFGVPSTRTPSSSRAGAPSSSRGPMSSGVWREPGRDVEENEIGFDDVTVSFDGRQARAALAALADQGDSRPDPGLPPTDSAPPPSFDDVPTRVEDSGTSSEVDALLSDMEPTVAMGDGFRAESRPLHSVPDTSDEEQTRVEQAERAPKAGDDSLLLSLDKLIQSADVPAAPAAPPEQDLFRDLDLGQQPGRSEPLDSLMVPGTGGYAQPALAPPQQQHDTAPKKKSRLGCWLVLLLFALVAGAAAGSFLLKQPPSLYGPDGMPKLPGLRR